MCRLIFVRVKCLLLQEKAAVEKRRWQKYLQGWNSLTVGKCFAGEKRVDRKNRKETKYAWESQDDISRSVFIPESVHDDKRNVDGNASGERKTNKV